jgi:hypothetical protein
MTLTHEERQAVDLGKKLTRRENQARNRTLRAERKERTKAVIASTAPGKRDPRQRDAEFLSWLHVDIPCIGCLIEGPGPVEFATIEACHLKISIAGKGWAKAGLGNRTHDQKCVAMCAWHHRLAANSCDTGGQLKFFTRVGLGTDVADFCRDLFNAFRAGNSGRDVVMAWVAAAKANRAEAAA